MPTADRANLIKALEKERGSTVLVYITGDRSPAGAQVSDDAMRPLHSLLRQQGPTKKLDLLLYTRGGAIDVPWRAVNALRQYSTTWDILIPFRANSAGTLIALGADEIVMGPQAELGPIDPSITVMRRLGQPGGGEGTPVQDTVSVEDVMAFVTFVQSRCKLKNEVAVASMLQKLTDRLDAVSLGNVYRNHAHIRDVAKRILKSRRQPAPAKTIASIVATLAEKVYTHGHAIGQKEAQQIGLPVVIPSDAVNKAMWALFEQYEADLKLLDPVDPAAVTANQDVYNEDFVLAAVENSAACWEFHAQVDIRAKRQVPQNLSVQMNANLQIDPALAGQPVQQQMQALLHQAQQQFLQNASAALQAALAAQAPVVGMNISVRGGKWKKVR
jgi:hypothetical protein